MDVDLVSRKLALDNFRVREKPLQPYESLGEGVNLAYSHSSQMRIFSEVAPISAGGLDALHLYCDEREAGEWLSLEIDVETNVHMLSIDLRYAPAEQVFISAIGLVDGSSIKHDIEALRVPDSVFKLRLEILAILEKFSKRPETLRIMLLFPGRAWFRLALARIAEDK